MLPLTYFVGSIPKTREAAAVHIAYELQNLTELTWRFHDDVMFSRFSKNSRQSKATWKLLSPYTLLGKLDTIVCHIFPQNTLNFLKIFPNAPRADLILVDKQYNIEATSLFYDKTFVIKSNDAERTYKRERPLPNRFSYANMKRLRPILIRYGKCVELITAFSKTVQVDRYRSALKAALRKVTKSLRYLVDQTKVYPIIEEYMKFGLPVGHTAETLAAEHTAEQVNDMLQGHPSIALRAESPI
tara:strand:+ start:1898 stop:2626 length:729 start_codon:yes stop_codon:yes gene_type:complete